VIEISLVSNIVQGISLRFKHPNDNFIHLKLVDQLLTLCQGRLDIELYILLTNIPSQIADIGAKLLLDSLTEKLDMAGVSQLEKS
jgi:hypothetical protein